MSSYNVISNGVHTFVKPPSLYCLPRIVPTTGSCLGYKMAFTHLPSKAPINSDPLSFVYFKLLNSLQRSSFWECFGRMIAIWIECKMQTQMNKNPQLHSLQAASWQLRTEVEKGSYCLVIYPYLCQEQCRIWKPPCFLKGLIDSDNCKELKSNCGTLCVVLVMSWTSIWKSCSWGCLKVYGIKIDDRQTVDR